MALGTQFSGIWTKTQQMRAVAALKWKNITLVNLYGAGNQDNNGELGDGTTINRSSPVLIGTATDSWISASGKSTTVLFRKPNGTIWSTGQNGSGMGGLNLPANTLRSSPTQIGDSSDWSMVQGGSYHSVAVKTNGTLWAWGRGTNGALGSNDIVYRSSPIQIGALTSWSKVSASRRSTFAIKTDNTLWSFGYNQQGNLGDGTVVSKSSPVQIGALTNWSNVSAGGDYVIAIKTDGTMWTWGGNGRGKLGLDQNAGNDKSSPVQIGTDTNWALGHAGNYTSNAIKTNGTLWAWGYNDVGQLGIDSADTGSSTGKSSPIQVGTLTNWSNVVTNLGNATAAIKTDGTAWTWGTGAAAMLAGGVFSYRSSPVQLGTDTNWTDLYGSSTRIYLIKTTVI